MVHHAPRRSRSLKLAIHNLPMVLIQMRIAPTRHRGSVIYWWSKAKAEGARVAGDGLDVHVFNHLRAQLNRWRPLRLHWIPPFHRIPRLWLRCRCKLCRRTKVLWNARHVAGFVLFVLSDAFLGDAHYLVRQNSRINLINIFLIAPFTRVWTRTIIRPGFFIF